MPQNGRAMRRGLSLAAAALLLASCGPNASEEAALSSAPVHHLVDALARHPDWRAGKCLCVGMFRGEEVEDFPAGLLTPEFARHKWVRNWSECAQYYGRAKGLAECKGGMADYICSIAERNDLPSGTTRVLCHSNGKNELLLDEYDVLEHGNVVHPVSLKVTAKLHEQ